MKLFICIYLISIVSSIDYEICSMINNKTITNKYASLVKVLLEKDHCSIKISNPWAIDMQNGFGVFLPRQIDCSSNITIECLPGSTYLQQTIPLTVQYTCHTRSDKIDLPCNLIELTYKRNKNIQDLSESIDVQIVALAKEPCTDTDILFKCPDDYLHSCINKKLQCNGRVECPTGYDELGCYHSSSTYTPITVIILAILAFVILICILSTVLICYCCRAAFYTIISRFRSTKKPKSIEKGEDAGLMKDLTTLPQQHTEPATFIIDSTKPVYPRLQ